MIEFDNEDDYNDYMIEWQRREQQREEEECKIASRHIETWIFILAYRTRDEFYSKLNE